MTRADDDSWDLATGVGATATAVATSRALATRAGTIDDPWAEPLVRAVGAEHFLAILDGGQSPDSADVDRLARGMVVRTRYFDDFALGCAAAGIRQTVILACGLDSRGHRLAWPAGSVVFDVDQPAVVEFKAATLTELGATSTARVHPIGVDLRDDWPAALTADGFDPNLPTAWIAEGLLMYLPPQAQDRLFDHITALSAPGSRLATEFMPSMDVFTEEPNTAGPEQDRWRRMGFQDGLAGLVYAGERSHVVTYLTDLGWEVTGNLIEELFAANGFDLPDEEMSQAFAGYQYVTAALG